ncbi:hypothetical protein JTB14_014953 [Gonioctena quinquepunctata]|nr:hypothetical protein JTB14_014953 [Gonioctena quinquepunctata]
MTDFCKQPIHEEGYSWLMVSEIKCLQLKSARVLRHFCNECKMVMQQILAILDILLRRQTEAPKLSQYTKPTSGQCPENFSMN